MKKAFRFSALLMAALIVLTLFASMALAEPEDDPATEDSSSEAFVPEDSSETEPESSEPESSEPEPESSEPEVSEPETSEPERQPYNITFTINGAGSITVYKTIGNELITTIASGTQTLTVNYAIKFKIDGKVLDVAWTEPQRAISGEYYYINPSRDSTVTVTVEGGNGNGNNNSEPEGPGDTPQSFNVRVQVGSGGSIKAGDRTISGGNGTNVTVPAGEDFLFTVTPDDGYELEYFKIDGVSVELTNNQYKLNTDAAVQSISVSFKTIGSEPATGIRVADIDWNADQITVDVKGNKAVFREVFDKIATLTADSSKYVAFVSEGGTIYVPYGRTSVGTSATVNMSISALQSGAALDTVSGIFGGDMTAFRAFSFNTAGNNLPLGTVVAFNLGMEFAGSKMALFTFDGTKLSSKSEAIAVSENGVSAKYEYSNENILVCAAGIPGAFTIESILMNNGGNINPAGKTEVEAGGSRNYVITAMEGYTIKQVLIDDKPIDGAAGRKNYIHVFENVGADHVIKVEFAAEAGGDDDDSGSEGGNGTLIVVLVIIAVAVIGAAALFIVKWRQEKY